MSQFPLRETALNQSHEALILSSLNLVPAWSHDPPRVRERNATKEVLLLPLSGVCANTRAHSTTTLLFNRTK